MAKERVFRTHGEALAGRELRSERRAGVPHYVPGQHHALIMADEEDPELRAALLTYVNPMGQVVAVVLAEIEGKWEPMMITSASQTISWGRMSAEGFELSAKMTEALRRADNESKGRGDRGET